MGVRLGKSIKILIFFFNILNVNFLGSKAQPSFVSRDVNETLIVNSVLFDIEVIMKERPCRS